MCFYIREYTSRPINILAGEVPAMAAVLAKAARLNNVSFVDVVDQVLSQMIRGFAIVSRD